MPIMQKSKKKEQKSRQNIWEGISLYSYKDKVWNLKSAMTLTLLTNTTKES